MVEVKRWKRRERRSQSEAVTNSPKQIAPPDVEGVRRIDSIITTYNLAIPISTVAGDISNLIIPHSVDRMQVAVFVAGAGERQRSVDVVFEALMPSGETVGKTIQVRPGTTKLEDFNTALPANTVLKMIASMGAVGIAATLTCYQGN